MTVSTTSASIPILDHTLSLLSSMLTKAEAYALEINIDPSSLLNARLAPDMYHLTAQVQIACDFAKGSVARLTGQVNPSFKDDESNFAELQTRIDRTRKFIAATDQKMLLSSDTRLIKAQFGTQALSGAGIDYLIGFAPPSFYFHVSMAYAILRHNGVPLEKRDFIGEVPGLANIVSQSEKRS
jgi:uncharacterized protein